MSLDKYIKISINYQSYVQKSFLFQTSLFHLLTSPAPTHSIRTHHLSIYISFNKKMDLSNQLNHSETLHVHLFPNVMQLDSFSVCHFQTGCFHLSIVHLGSCVSSPCLKMLKNGFSSLPVFILYLSYDYF